MISRTPESWRAPRRRRRYWLISSVDGSRTETFTVDLGTGEEALPVFGVEEEADMYVFLASLEPRWKPRETSTGELLSVLYGPCRRVDHVALDPPPGGQNGNASDLLSREYFTRLLAG